MNAIEKLLFEAEIHKLVRWLEKIKYREPGPVPVPSPSAIFTDIGWSQLPNSATMSYLLSRSLLGGDPDGAPGLQLPVGDPDGSPAKVLLATKRSLLEHYVAQVEQLRSEIKALETRYGK
jgi:hypothetical protein